jgi:hypothetical protein
VSEIRYLPDLPNASDRRMYRFAWKAVLSVDSGRRVRLK